MNEPVAWMDYLEHSDVYDLNVSGRGIPLYTHPVKEQLTDEEFDNIFAHGKRLGVLETEDRFRKAMKLKDEEIIGCWDGVDPPDECWITDEHLVLFARAILRKAQEK